VNIGGMREHSKLILFLKIFLNRIKRRFVKNPIDKRVEDFLLSISSNEYLKQVLQNKDKAQVYAFIIQKFYDLGNFHHLYLEIIIPRQLQHIKKMNRYAKGSFYARLLKRPLRFDDDIFEVVRIGYVHLYHKYESYIHTLCPFLDDYLTRTFNEDISIVKFLIKLFEYDLFDLKYQPPELRKINWIANCVKHYNSLPRKKDPPGQFANADLSQKIKIGQEEFGNDILFLLDYFMEIFSICLYTGYTEFAFTKAGKLTEPQQDSLKDTELQLKAGLLSRLVLLSGKFKEPGIRETR
jgi:hypothetical protein